VKNLRFSDAYLTVSDRSETMSGRKEKGLLSNPQQNKYSRKKY
jgi:hypothetical protein